MFFVGFQVKIKKNYELTNVSNIFLNFWQFAGFGICEPISSGENIYKIIEF